MLGHVDFGSSGKEKLDNIGTIVVCREVQGRLVVVVMEKGTSKDGHDQMPLRKVLYRHRNDVYDLPARVQRRGLSHSPCEGEPLLWHAHRSDRVKWARIHKHGAAEVCGFVV